jgi:hypothetical protein
LMLRQTAPTFPKNLTDFIVDSSRAQASRKKNARDGTHAASLDRAP